jgi:hypothetical protein
MDENHTTISSALQRMPHAIDAATKVQSVPKQEQQAGSFGGSGFCLPQHIEKLYKQLPIPIFFNQWHMQLLTLK